MKDKIKSIIWFGLWLFFTFGNIGCAVGFGVKYAITNDPMNAIPCAVHILWALWIGLCCNPKKRIC